MSTSIEVPINGNTPVYNQPTTFATSAVNTYDGGTLTCAALSITLNTSDTLNSVISKLLTGLCSTKGSLNTLTTTVSTNTTNIATNTSAIAAINLILSTTGKASSFITSYDGTAVTNFTPTASTLNGYLKGIDNKFGTLVSGGATKQDIYDNTAPLLNNYVITGLTPSTTSKHAKVSSGTLYINGHYVVASSYDNGSTLPASKDNWVAVLEDSSYSLVTVTIGATPTLPSTGYWIAKYQTDSSSNVTITDARTYLSFKANTVGYAALDVATQNRQNPSNLSNNHMAYSNGTTYADAGTAICTNGTKIGVGTSSYGSEYLTVNSGITITDAIGTTAGTIRYTGGDFGFRNGTDWIQLASFVTAASNTFAALVDVNLTGYATGQVATYNGSVWTNTTNGVFNTISTDADSYTLGPNETILMVNTFVGGAKAIQLPLAADVSDGKIYYIYDSGNNANVNQISLSTAGADTFAGAPLVINIRYEGRMVIVNATKTGWQLFYMYSL